MFTWLKLQIDIFGFHSTEICKYILIFYVSYFSTQRLDKDVRHCSAPVGAENYKVQLSNSIQLSNVMGVVVDDCIYNCPKMETGNFQLWLRLDLYSFFHFDVFYMRSFYWANNGENNEGNYLISALHNPLIIFRRIKWV